MLLICALVRTAMLDVCACVETVLVHAIVLAIAGHATHALGAGALAALVLAITALTLRRSRRQAHNCRITITDTRGLHIRLGTRFTVAIALTTIAYQTTALVAAPLSSLQHLWTWLAAALAPSACMRPLTLLFVLRHVPPANPALWLCGYEDRIGMTPYGDLIPLYTRNTPAPTAVYRAVTTGQYVEHTAHGEPETARRLAFHAS